MVGSSKGLAGMERGYLYQDIVGGMCLLSVLFDEAEAVEVESPSPIGRNDKFDDVVLHRNDETICFQVKNGPDYTFSGTDLDDSSSGRLNLEELVECAKSRNEINEGSRFIVFTSYNAPRQSDIQLADTSSNLEFFGGLEFETKKLDGDLGSAGDDIDIEFIFDAPGINEIHRSDPFHGLEQTEIFLQILENVSPIHATKENPRVNTPSDLILRAITLSTRAREDPGHRLTRKSISEEINIAPSLKRYPQSLSVDEGCILPFWFQQLEESLVDIDGRTAIQGVAGSGKSTGLELLHNSIDGLKSTEIVRYNLYDPDDKPSQAEDRIDPSWFRDQLVGEFHRKLPEVFSENNAPIWTGIDDLQAHLDKVAEWCSENDHNVVIIVDGIDHALPEPAGSNTESDIEGTVIEEVGQLEFPGPLIPIFVGRPLSDEVYSVLRIDQTRTISTWGSEEIERYYTQNGISVDESLISSVEDVSGGLPVILSHLLSEAETSEGDLDEGLRNAIEEAPNVSGDLEEYYEEIWSPINPHLRDVLSLQAARSTAIHADVVVDVLSLPWMKSKSKLGENVLSHTLEEAEKDHYRIFHESFREFILEKLDSGQEEEIHKSLYDYYLDEQIESASNTDALRFHAERGPGLEALRELATVEHVFHWWREGVHINKITSSLNLALEGAQSVIDYETALDCTILGATTHGMLDIYVDNRLEYFRAIGDKRRAFKFTNQLRDEAPGTEGSLEAIQEITKEWPEELDKSWLQDWYENWEAADKPRDWNPEAYFEVAVKNLDPDQFWEHARVFVTDKSNEHFTYQIFRAISYNTDVLKERPEPPGWLFDDLPKTLEACELIWHQIPEEWQTELVDDASSVERLSCSALRTLLLCGYDREEILAEIQDRKFAEPKDHREEYPQHSEAFYVGAVLADTNHEPDEILELIEEMSEQRSRLHQFAAIVGAATTRSSPEEESFWVNYALDEVRQILENKEFERSEEGHTDYLSYRPTLQDLVEDFSVVTQSGSEDKIDSVLAISDNNNYENPVIDTLARGFLNHHDHLQSEDELPAIWEARYQDLIQAVPDEPISPELLDLAHRAAQQDQRQLAEKYFNKAIERAYRYGYHKDTFLSDVWDGLDETVDGDWEGHLGKAIQLVNWADLLHTITDSDSVSHLEFKFLSILLENDAVEYETVPQTVHNLGTSRRLRKWRLRNPEGIDHSELQGLLYLYEKWRRSRSHSSKNTEYLGRAAIIADQHGWGDLVKYALELMHYGEYVEEGLSKEQAAKIESLSEEYSTAIPDTITEEEDSDDYSSDPDPKPEPISEDLHQVLLIHSFEEPASVTEFEEYETGELLEARQFIITYRDYRPSVAAPVAKSLAQRGEHDSAVSLLKKTIAHRRLLISWYGPGRFEELAEVLLELEGDRALEIVFDAWMESDIDSRTNQGILPQLVWIIKRTKGDMEAIEYINYTMEQLRLLFSPYDDSIQRWGALQNQLR
ncbi:hypothetical protein [Halorubrum ezzemoulense]|uniref:hypothetical protein n=1 Tax=Halorubrum ezzemoulense TaxID=337243 RepID=UPI00232E2D24|nr:hypothetical protein [Halorubrum ezzemoulense]MDB2249245.1 hypothetical protein [Halorubrum ezzemoulense]